MRVRPALISVAVRRGLVTKAGTRLAAVVLLVGLLVGPPLLLGRGGGSPTVVPSAADPPFSETPSGGVLVTRVYAHAARDNEFVELGNPGETTANLSGWSLTDREATATFPAGSVIPPGGRVVVTRNATTFEEDVRASPDFTWDGGDAPLLEGGVLRLADAGDEVLLLDPTGRVVDALAYGASTYEGPGWIGPPSEAPGRGELSVRIRDGEGWADTDRADDWAAARPYRLGQSDVHPPAVVLDVPPVVLLSPDDGVTPVLSFLSSASRTLDLGVYTLTSESVAAVLAERLHAGARVRVLLEGSPVGGVSEKERGIVAALVDAGAEVRWLHGGDDVVKRYRYLHAKYAIVDGRAVLVTSENLGDAGFPAQGGSGNRGWSAILEDLTLAGQLWDVFQEDFDPERRDTVAASMGIVTDLRLPPPIPPWRTPAERCCVTAKLVLGPDNAQDDDRILGLLRSAQDRIDIEAFYLEDLWPTGPNPFLEAAFDAAHRGVVVRILLDGSSWSSETPEDGSAAVAGRINARARAEGLRVEAKLLPPTGTIERVHNKGVAVDGRAVLVSSMNWAYVSATQDREVGVILEDTATARRFADAFDADWEGRSTDLPGGLDLSDPLATAAVYALVAGVCALSLWKLRPGDKGTSGPLSMRRRGRSLPRLRGRRGEVRVLSAELVAQPRARAGRGPGDRRGRETTRGRLEGSQGDRGPRGLRPRGGGRGHVLRRRGNNRRDRGRDVPPRLPD